MDEARIDIDVNKVLYAFERMEMKHFKGAVRKTMRQGANIIKKSVVADVKTRYPHGKLHPKNPGRKAGFLKGTIYGPLYKDVKSSVWKSSKGANVSLFSQRKQNRWCVLMWLNDGTNERGSKRSDYIKTGRKKKKFSNANGSLRGKIAPSNFFQDDVAGSKALAQDYIARELPNNVIESYDKYNQS